MDASTEVFEPTSRRRSKSQARAARKRAKSEKEPGTLRSLAPKTARQRDYIDRLRRGENVFGIGPAGTGKSYVAARIAAAKLLRGEISRIVISRATVTQSRHRLGFLPGSFESKMRPWLVPIFDAFRAEVSQATIDKWIAAKQLEVVPFEHMRGRSFGGHGEPVFVLLDEAQNSSLGDLKLFLTRLGEGAQAAVNGDLEQLDIADSGLARVIDLAERYQVPMAVVRFEADDVVRSAFVKAWVKAFAEAGKAGILDRPCGMPHTRRQMS